MNYIKCVIVGMIVSAVSVIVLLLGVFLPATYSIMATLLLWPLATVAVLGFVLGCLWQLRRNEQQHGRRAS